MGGFFGLWKGICVLGWDLEIFSIRGVLAGLDNQMI
jgi:hypothetical protein